MKTNPPLRPYSSPVRVAVKPPTPEPSERPLPLRILIGTLRWTFRISMLIILLAGGAAGGAYTALRQNFAKLSDVSQLERYAPIEATEILDSQGKLLYKLYGEENRKVIPLADVPEHVQKAVISAEDARFYEHKGVDPMGLARALKINFDSGDAVQGGSTITQQVVKNLFLTPERTVQRKLAEMWMALEVEKRYTKSQILELYLNQIYWGHNAYGIEAASQNYFGKPTAKLNLSEGALLAGILTGPELHSPYRNPKQAKHRQELTLNRMADIGFINYEQAKEAAKVKLKYPGIKAGTMKFPYFTSYALAVIKHNYGDSAAFKRGLKVYTTLNADWQAQAEKNLRDHINRNRGSRVTQGALVAIENKTGFVRAIVGGTNYKQSQFNRAWQAHRQPGSAFKPFVYLTAFARGFKPQHLEVDEPIRYRFGSYMWKPRNYGGGHSGRMTLQRALEQSNNIIAVKLGERVGNGNVIDTAHRLGIRSGLNNVISLPLGPSEVTPLEMASAYSSIARNGTYLEPTPILRVEDRYGNLLEDNSQRQAESVYSDEACSMLIQVMKGVINRGTAATARIGRPAAGKTGTTSDHKDAWFVGFTPQITTAVWVGNDKPQTMYGYATGGHLSAPLWARFMLHAHRWYKPQDFPKAKGQMPVLAGIPIDEPGNNAGFTPTYERLGPKDDDRGKNPNDPFQLDLDQLTAMMEQGQTPNIPPPSQQTTGMLDMQAPPVSLPAPNEAPVSAEPVYIVPEGAAPITDTGITPDNGPPASPRNEKIISELDALLDDLDQRAPPASNAP